MKKCIVCEKREESRDMLLCELCERAFAKSKLHEIAWTARSVRKYERAKARKKP